MNRSYSKIHPHKVINYIGLISIGVTCYLYTIFSRDFAKLHFVMPSLEIPIFAGEILFFFCFGLFLIKIVYFKAYPKRLLVTIFLLIGWLLVKVFLGYKTGGALALRTAALFYYALFFIFGYSFFERDFFSSKICVGLVVGMFLTFYFSYIVVVVSIFRYLQVAFIGLMIMLAMHVHQKWFRYLAVLLIVILFPHNDPFQASRTHLVAFVLALLFLLTTYVCFVLKIKKVYKFSILLIPIVYLIVGLGVYSEKNKLYSLINFDGLASIYRKALLKINANENTRNESTQNETIENKNIQNKSIQNETIQKERKDIKLLSDHKQVSRELSVKSLDDQIWVPAAELLDKDVEQQIGTVIDYNIKIMLKELNTALDAYQKSHNRKTTFEEARADFEHIIEFLLTEKMDIISDALLDILNDRTGQQRATLAEYYSVNTRVRDKINAIRSRLNFALMHTVNWRIRSFYGRSLDNEHNNVLFRVFIWKDMFFEMVENRSVWGVNFGQPQRSRSIETLRWAERDIAKVGWITPHNSFLHMIYRGGIIGVLFIVFAHICLFRLIKASIRLRSLAGIFLSSIFIYWYFIINFLVFLEVPYTAVPFWSMLGMAHAYIHESFNRS